MPQDTAEAPHAPGYGCQVFAAEDVFVTSGAR